MLLLPQTRQICWKYALGKYKFTFFEDIIKVDRMADSWGNVTIAYGAQLD